MCTEAAGGRRQVAGVLLLVLAFASRAVFACGICVEDRVAAVFDNAIVEQAVGARRHVAFFGIEGALPATAESRRAILEALYASGGVKGSARVSLESASCSVAFDPRKTSLAALRDGMARRLAARELTLATLRTIDAGGVLREPGTVR
jgi:hypothetical protein